MTIEEKMKESIKNEITKFIKERDKFNETNQNLIKDVETVISDHESKKRERLAPHQRQLKSGKTVPVKGFGAPKPETPSRPQALEIQREGIGTAMFEDEESWRAELKNLSDMGLERWEAQVLQMEAGPEKDWALNALMEEIMSRETDVKETEEREKQQSQMEELKQLGYHDLKQKRRQIKNKMNSLDSTKEFMQENGLDTSAIEQAKEEMEALYNMIIEEDTNRTVEYGRKKGEFFQKIGEATTIAQINRARRLINQSDLPNEFTDELLKEADRKENRLEEERRRREAANREQRRNRLRGIRNAVQRGNMIKDRKKGRLQEKIDILKHDISQQRVDPDEGKEYLKELEWNMEQKMDCPPGKHKEPSAPDGSYMAECHEEKIKHRDWKGDISNDDRVKNTEIMHQLVTTAKTPKEVDRLIKSFYWMYYTENIARIAWIDDEVITYDELETIGKERKTELKKQKETRAAEAKQAVAANLPIEAAKEEEIKKWTKEELDNIKAIPGLSRMRRLGYMIKALGYRRWDSHAGSATIERMYDILMNGRLATGEDAMTERQMKEWITMKKTRASQAFHEALKNRDHELLYQMLQVAYRYGRVAEIARIERAMKQSPAFIRRGNKTRPNRRGTAADFTEKNKKFFIHDTSYPYGKTTKGKYIDDKILYGEAEERRGFEHVRSKMSEEEKRDKWWRIHANSEIHLCINRGSGYANIYLIESSTGKTLASGTGINLVEDPDDPDCGYIDMGAWGVAEKADHLGFGLPVLGFKLLKHLRQTFKEERDLAIKEKRKIREGFAPDNIKYHTVTEHSGDWVGEVGVGYAGSKKFRDDCGKVHKGKVQSQAEILSRKIGK